MTFLTGNRTFKLDIPAHELFLELVHPGSREQKRRVVSRHKDITRNNGMPLVREKLQKPFPYFVRIHDPGLPLYLSLSF